MLVLKQLGDPLETDTLVKARPPPVPALKKRGWPLPIIAFIDQAVVVEEMLTYPALRPAHTHGPPEAAGK